MFQVLWKGFNLIFVSSRNMRGYEGYDEDFMDSGSGSIIVSL